MILNQLITAKGKRNDLSNYYISVLNLIKSGYSLDRAKFAALSTYSTYLSF